MEFILCAIIMSLTTPPAVELFVFIGEGGWNQPISIRFWRIDTISLVVTKRAPSSASADDDMKDLMIWAMIMMG